MNNRGIPYDSDRTLEKYWRFISETKAGNHHIISLKEEGKQGLHFRRADV
jgi:hypothetical protein